jgi:hypothetical protein
MGDAVTEYRMGRKPNGMLIHYCYCGKWGTYGFRVSLLHGKDGVWYCRDHKSEGALPVGKRLNKKPREYRTGG